MPKHLGRIELSLYRDKSGISKKMYTKYSLIVFKNKKHILSSQKMNMFGTSHYNITMEECDMSKSGAGYLGKLRSSNSTKEYNLFGPGENPSSGASNNIIREQLGAIIYVTVDLN